jgi:hypothetical protein
LYSVSLFYGISARSFAASFTPQVPLADALFCDIQDR